MPGDTELTRTPSAAHSIERVLRGQNVSKVHNFQQIHLNSWQMHPFVIMFDRVSSGWVMVIFVSPGVAFREGGQERRSITERSSDPDPIRIGSVDLDPFLGDLN